MRDEVAELIDVVTLEERGTDCFRGRTPDMGWKRVFGGQVVAQALAAALATVEAERHVHSLHGYFLRPGDPKRPIDYSVDRFRDGRSFTTRGVVARQEDEIIFTMSSSFHLDETGFAHQAPMPDVRRPEDLPDQQALLRDYGSIMPPAMKQFFQRRWPVELRPVDPEAFVDPSLRRPAVRHIWLRALSRLPADPKLHLCTLAYASDLNLIDAALLPHGRSLFDADLMLASLDHGIWFHRPFRADEWLLFAQESPSSSGGRGFNRGLIFTAEGELAASIVQEGLMRIRRPQ